MQPVLETLSLGSTWAILGIIITLIGTVVLAVSTVLEPSFLAREDFRYGHQQVIDIVHEAMSKGWDNLPETERKQRLTQADAERHHRLEQLAAKVTAAQVADRSRGRRGTFWGLIIVAAGSVAQGIAILMI